MINNIVTTKHNKMNYKLLTTENTKALFNVRRVQFNKARAVRDVAKRFEVSQADVLRAAYYW